MNLKGNSLINFRVSFFAFSVQTSVYEPIWPLDANIRKRLMKFQTELKEIRTTGVGRWLETDIQDEDGSNVLQSEVIFNNAAVDTKQGITELDLFDILHRNGCLPASRLGSIKHGSLDLRNQELSQILINGSIKTFQIIAHFLEMTRQIRMLNIFARNTTFKQNYIAEGNVTKL